MRAKDFWIQFIVLLIVGAATVFGQKPITPTKIVSAHIVLDPVQAKYPGNEHVKECRADNHDGTCFDPNMHHIVNHLYGGANEVTPRPGVLYGQAMCEKMEAVSCEAIYGERGVLYWVPVGKPVFVDETSGSVTTIIPGTNITHGEPTAFDLKITAWGLDSDSSGRIIKMSDEEYAGLEKLRKTVADEEKRIAKEHGVELRTIDDNHFMVQPDRYQFRGQFILVNLPMWEPSK